MNTTLGDLIFCAREANELTQEDLANACGVSNSYISKIEAGERMPSQDVLQKLAETLGLEYFQLVSLLPVVSNPQEESMHNKTISIDKAQRLAEVDPNFSYLVKGGQAIVDQAELTRAAKKLAATSAYGVGNAAAVLDRPAPRKTTAKPVSKAKTAVKTKAPSKSQVVDTCHIEQRYLWNGTEKKKVPNSYKLVQGATEAQSDKLGKKAQSVSIKNDAMRLAYSQGESEYVDNLGRTVTYDWNLQTQRFEVFHQEGRKQPQLVFSQVLSRATVARKHPSWT